MLSNNFISMKSYVSQNQQISCFCFSNLQKTVEETFCNPQQSQKQVQKNFQKTTTNLSKEKKTQKPLTFIHKTSLKRQKTSSIEYRKRDTNFVTKTSTPLEMSVLQNSKKIQFDDLKYLPLTTVTSGNLQNSQFPSNAKINDKDEQFEVKPKKIMRSTPPSPPPFSFSHYHHQQSLKQIEKSKFHNLSHHKHYEKKRFEKTSLDKNNLNINWTKIQQNYSISNNSRMKSNYKKLGLNIKKLVNNIQIKEAISVMNQSQLQDHVSLVSQIVDKGLNAFNYLKDDERTAISSQINSKKQLPLIINSF